MPINGAVFTTTFTYRMSPMPKKPPMIDAALRKAIKSSGVTHYTLGQVAGVAPCQIDRFMHPADDPRHRDIRLETAGKLAAALGLVLVAVPDAE